MNELSDSARKAARDRLDRARQKVADARAELDEIDRVLTDAFRLIGRAAA